MGTKCVNAQVQEHVIIGGRGRQDIGPIVVEV